MAKSVIEAIRRREALAGQQPVTRASSAGQAGLGFRKDFSDSEIEQIETERRQMRARLLAEG